MIAFNPRTCDEFNLLFRSLYAEKMHGHSVSREMRTEAMTLHALRRIAHCSLLAYTIGTGYSHPVRGMRDGMKVTPNGRKDGEG